MKQLSNFCVAALAVLLLAQPVSAVDQRIAIDLDPDPQELPAPSTLLLMAGAAGLLALKRKKR